MNDSRPRLQSLIFEVTRRCNHACRYCYNFWQATEPIAPVKKEPGSTQILDLLGKALDECLCRHVTLTGGEPLLHEDLVSILDFLQRRGIQVTVISNGRLLDGERAVSLVRHGVDLFELPLLSHQASVHDGLAGSSGAWKAVLNAMAEVRLHRGTVVAAFVATRLNIDHLAETIRLAIAFGARGLMFNRFNPGGRGISGMQELMPSLSQVIKALEVAETASREFHFPISCSIPIQPCLVDLTKFPHLGFGYCAVGSPRAYYTLEAGGNLRPCNHSTTVLGNLFNETFADLVSPDRLSSFTSALPEFCKACSVRMECQGGCKASAQVCFGSLSAEEPFLRQRHVSATSINPITTIPIPTSLGG